MVRVSSVAVVLLVLACGDESPAAGSSTKMATNSVATFKVTAKPKGEMIFSLADQRLHAHQTSGDALVVDGASAGFVKYIRYKKNNYTWKWGQKVAGRLAAKPNKKVASLKVPLTAKQAASGKVSITVHSDSAATMTIRPNGEKSKEATVSMPGGWFDFDAQLQGLRNGENDLQFYFGKSSNYAVEKISVGEAGAEIATLADNSVVLGKDGGVVYYTSLPLGASLYLDATGNCKVTVEVVTDSGETVSGTISSSKPNLRLDKVWGKPSRIWIKGNSCDKPFKLAGLYSEKKQSKQVEVKKPKQVVLWIMDSLRADRVPQFMAGARAEAPNFGKLLKTSTFFTHAYVQGNESRASHASIWSGLYPAKHKMISSKRTLSYDWETIDEVAKSAGYTTVGVSANGYVAKKWGFVSKWDKYRNHIHEGGGLEGGDLLKRGMKMLSNLNKPWFFYIGTIDTHVSWRAKEPWMSKYRKPGYSGNFKKVFSGSDAGKAAGGSLKLSKADIENVRAIYDSNVSYQDKLLGDFLAKLEADGTLNDTMIIITADHGDEQWEHGRVGHGGSLRETLIHVPLVVHYPPMFPAGKVTTGVEVIDILPTVAEVTGQKADNEWQGESLVSLANNGTTYPQMNLASQFENKHAAALGGWKVVASGASKPKLFNIAQDPGEKQNLVDSHPIARRTVTDPLWLLRYHNKRWRKTVWGNPARVSNTFAKQVETEQAK